jgi:hypothetical protein
MSRRVEVLLILPLLAMASALSAAPLDIHDIHGPLPPEAVPPFILTGGMVLLFGWLFWLRRRQPTAEVAPLQTLRPDARTVMARLVAEYRDGICSREELCVRLDAIVRDVLGVRVGMPAHERTSTELRQEAATRLDERTVVILRDLLLFFDLIKFAGHRPDDAEIDGALGAAAGLVDDLSRDDRP